MSLYVCGEREREKEFGSIGCGEVGLKKRGDVAMEMDHLPSHPIVLQAFDAWILYYFFH